MFEPLSPSLSLRDRIVQDLLGKIESEELKPGDRLLPERELAAAYHVSRTAVRDALRTLSGLGVVTIRHGHGVFIRGSQGLALGQALWAPFVVRNETVAYLFEVRKSLEVQASGWAALRGNAAQKEYLGALVTAAKDAVNPEGKVDRAVAAEADQAFHTHLFIASGNPIAGRLMLNLLDLLAEVRQKSLEIAGRAALSILDHERIADAVRAGDAKRARVAMRDHLEAVEAAILSALDGELHGLPSPGHIPKEGQQSGTTERNGEQKRG